jgi:hypothetical protein
MTSAWWLLLIVPMSGLATAGLLYLFGEPLRKHAVAMRERRERRLAKREVAK